MASFGIPTWGYALIMVAAAMTILAAWWWESLRDPESDPRRVGEAAGKSIATALTKVGSALWVVPAAVVRQLTYTAARFLPVIGAKWWKGVTLFSLKAYHRRSGGDALALLGNEHAGSASFAPLKWKDDVATDEDEQPGWKVKGEDRTFEDSNHDSVFRVGNVPMVLVNKDETRSGSWLEANVTEAIDAGNMTEVYDVESAELRATIDYGDAVPGAAMSDGGANVSREFEPRESPVFKDMLIDLTSGEHFDGRAISWTKYSDHDPTTTSPEEIDRAQERGWLAGLAGHGDNTAFVIKVLLIALGMVATFVLGPDLISALFASGGGGGGGGGGGIIPFALGSLGVL
jgi:hypothetical protein